MQKQVCCEQNLTIRFNFALLSLSLWGAMKETLLQPHAKGFEIGLFC